jgi:hypothetical protein
MRQGSRKSRSGSRQMNTLSSERQLVVIALTYAEKRQSKHFAALE